MKYTDIKDRNQRMKYLRDGGKLECPVCEKGTVSALNPYIIKCDSCNYGIVGRVKLNIEL